MRPKLLVNVGSKAPSLSGTLVEIPVVDGPRAAMEALRLLDQNGLAPTDFRLREPSLDDVFLALTGERAEDERTEEDGEGATSGRRSRRDRQASDAKTPGASADTTTSGGVR